MTIGPPGGQAAGVDPPAVNRILTLSEPESPRYAGPGRKAKIAALRLAPTSLPGWRNW